MSRDQTDATSSDRQYNYIDHVAAIPNKIPNCFAYPRRIVCSNVGRRQSDAMPCSLIIPNFTALCLKSDRLSQTTEEDIDT